MLASLLLAASFSFPVAAAQAPGAGETRPSSENALLHALLQAVRRADLERVRRILRDGVDPKPADAQGRSKVESTSPLCLAVNYNELAIARLLLENGLSVDAKDAAGAAPIHFVRSPEMATLLVDAGADLTALDADGYGALARLRPFPIGGLRWTSPAMARFASITLIEAGAAPTLTDAIWLGLPEQVEALLLDAPTPTTEDLYHAILSDADTGSLLRILRALLANGAPMDGPPPDTQVMNWSYARPLAMHAVHNGKLDAACFLVESGATLPNQTALGWTPIKGRTIYESEQGDLLDRAIEEGHLGLVMLLLSRGFPPSHCGPTTFLGQQHRAARVNRAAWRGHREIALELIRAGAETRAIYGDCSPALAAAAGGRPLLHDELIAAGVSPSIHAAALLGRDAELDALLNPQTLNRCDGRMGCSPIAWAILGRRPDAVRLLIEAGADLKLGVAHRAPFLVPSRGLQGSLMPRLIDDEDQQTISLTALAVMGGSWEIAKALLDAGAPADRSFITALATSRSPHATDLLARALVSPGRDRDPGWSDEALRTLAREEPGAALRRLARTGYDLALGELPMNARMGRVNLLLGAGASTNLADGSSLVDAVAHAAVMPVVEALLAGGAKVSVETACLLDLDGHGATDEFLRALEPEARRTMIWSASRAGRVTAILRLLDTAGESHAEHVQYVRDHAPWHHPVAIAALTDAGVIPQGGEETQAWRMREQIRNASLLGEYLMSGVSIEALERPHRTLLHEACLAQSPQSIRLLLNAGLDPNRRSADGETCFDLLDLHRQNSLTIVDCAECLLEFGADPMRFGVHGVPNFEFPSHGDASTSTIQAIEHLMAPNLPSYLTDQDVK